MVRFCDRSTNPLTMDQKVLTSQIAASYFGCEVLFSGRAYKLSSINEYGIIIKELDNHHVTFDLCQLILKPFSEITDADCEAVVALMSQADYGPLDVTDIPSWLDEVMNGNSALSADYVSGQQVQIIIDFLRSRSYDCGYSEIPSLIEAGIAININK